MGSDTRAASVRSPRPDGVRPCLVPASETGGSGEGGPSSPPRERGSHMPLFISIKILWRTWCPLGGRGGTGHLGLEPLTKSALASWQGGPSLCVHTGRNRGPRLPSPEGLRAGCAWSPAGARAVHCGPARPGLSDPVPSAGGHSGRRQRVVAGIITCPELDPAPAQDAAIHCPPVAAPRGPALAQPT